MDLVKELMNMSFGAKLKALRKQRGITQTQIAEELGIRQNTYSDYENDKTQPSIESIVKICKLLDVPADVLFYDEVNEDTNSISNAVSQYLQDRGRLIDKIKKYHDAPNDELRHDIKELFQMLSYWNEEFKKDTETLNNLYLRGKKAN
jgi:transcriptional regulator with XRE-family HTH domain